MGEQGTQEVDFLLSVITALLTLPFFFNLVLIPSLTLLLRSLFVSVKQESLFVICTVIFELNHVNRLCARYSSIGFIKGNCLSKYVCFI